MRIFKALVLQMLAISIFTVFICIYVEVDVTMQHQEGVELYQKDWMLAADGEAVFYEELPDVIETNGSGMAAVYRKLNEADVEASSLCFYTSHQNVSVFVDDELIYQVAASEIRKSKTPGNFWNFVELSREYQNKELRIELEECYGSSEVVIPEFYYGSESTFMMWYILQQLMPLLLSLVTFIIGVALVVIFFSLRNSMRVSEGVLWLGMFAIPLAIWSGIESQVLTFFTFRTLLISQVTFMVLKLLPIPILQFVSVIYGLRSDKGIQGICLLSILDFWICSLLQFTGWLDYKETIGATLLICIAAAVYVLAQTINIFLEKGERSAKSRRTITIHAVCVGIVAVCVLLDVISYSRNLSMDSARFSRMALLIYIVVLALQFLNDSVQLVRAGQKVGELRHEAETDAMTMLKNRRSYEKDLYAANKEEKDDYGIVLCDLNNLKKINDSYGHSMGDSYIIISSEIIQDTFGRYGTVYRIGGDEFCAIVKHMDEELAERLQEEMDERFKALYGIEHRDLMQVAMGYAGYDKRQDVSLSDTMKRADKLMYQRKKKMKAAAV